MTETLNLHPSAAVSLAKWHDMLAKQNLSDLGDIVHTSVVFRSPVAHSTYHGADTLIFILRNVIEVFGNFTYHRQAATADGLNVVLEFSANIGDKAIKGIDFIRFDEAGKIIEFEVMTRPLSGTQALAAAMGKRIAAN